MLRKFRSLGKPADPDPVLGDHLPFVRFFLSSDHAEQSSFTGSVYTDDTYFFSLIDAAGDIIKYHLISKNFVDMFYIKNVHAHFLRFLPKYIKIISMIANFHDSVKNHCYDRGKGCTSNLEVQPSWGIVFYLDFGQQFLVSPAAALIFRISTAFRIF